MKTLKQRESARQNVQGSVNENSWKKNEEKNVKERQQNLRRWNVLKRQEDLNVEKAEAGQGLGQVHVEDRDDQGQEIEKGKG